MGQNVSQCPPNKSTVFYLAKHRHIFSPSVYIIYSWARQEKKHSQLSYLKNQRQRLLWLHGDRHIESDYTGAQTLVASVTSRCSGKERQRESGGNRAAEVKYGGEYWTKLSLDRVRWGIISYCMVMYPVILHRTRYVWVIGQVLFLRVYGPRLRLGP